MSGWYDKIQKMGDGLIADQLTATSVAKKLLIPSPSFNWAVGGGLVFGKIATIYGPEQSGKSLIAQLAIASLHAEDPEAWALWYDAEYSFDSDYAGKLGVDLKRLLVIQSNKPSDIFDHFVDKILPMLQATDPFPLKIMVIDSIKSIRGPKEADTDSVEQHVMGDLSQLLQKAFRKIIPPLKQHGILTICVQQVSEEFDQTKVMQGHKWHVPSGMALRHASDYMVLVEKVENKASKIFDETHRGISNMPIQLGHIIRCKVEKNRVNCPHLVAQFRLQYGVGVVDTELEICELGVNLGVVGRPTQAAYTFEGTKVVGFANFVEKIRSTPELYRALNEAISKVNVFEKRDLTPSTTGVDGAENE
jgi:recombination protein RecA